MPALLPVFFFGFGAVIGSFVNAVLWRLHAGESIAHGRSYCPHCRHTLGPADLVPIISFILLRGRCRYCRKGIDAQYLLIELALGLAFLVIAASTLPLGSAFDLAWTDLARLLLRWYLAAVLLIVFVFDLRHMLVLPSVTLPATVIAAAANIALGLPWQSVALGCAFGAGLFWLQYALSRGAWIGDGDIYLGLLLGAMLGFRGTLLAIFLAYIAGAIIGLALIASRKLNRKSQVPFGTFLAAAAFVAMLYGDRLIEWYSGLLY